LIYKGWASLPVIFVVDDEPLVAAVLKTALEKSGYRVRVFGDAEQALLQLPVQNPFLVLLDVHLPGINGLEALGRIQKITPQTEVMMISGYATIDVAVEAMKKGAVDFLTKPLQLPEVISRVERSYETHRLRDEVAALRDRQRQEFLARHHIGSGAAMTTVYHMAGQVAKFPNIIALITGASGTGKEMLARYLHFRCPYAQGPFVVVNCAAISPELIESELFGYEAGAFTDALTEGKKGLIERAELGTLFLDEIGELSTPLQVKLLRFLQDRSFTRVGGTKSQHLDCNIISSTNRRLESMVEQGLFRPDLYYRINVIRLHVPSLKERPEDILFFAKAFLSEIAQGMGRIYQGFDERAQQKLIRQEWPGNLRELHNVIERACLLAEGPLLTASDLVIRSGEMIADLGPALDALLPMEQAMSLYVRRVLEAVGGNKSEAARLLGISRNRLKRTLNPGS